MPYDLIHPKHTARPILLSVPHSGTAFPEEIVHSYVQEMIVNPDDTDWFVDQLYDFVSDMGITIIRAKYSRWVIDLNRNPKSQPLYNDGRVITGLTTLTTFNNESIYKEDGPDNSEISRRLREYYTPYYDKVQSLLDDWQQHYDHVLFFDAHSIRQHVPGIQKAKFPDLILGDADETSAHKNLINEVDQTLSESPYEYTHNTPFKGGHLTRNFGNPNKKQHALQLEMSKTVYMDDAEVNYHPERANQIKIVLKSMFEKIIMALDGLNGSK